MFRDYGVYDEGRGVEAGISIQNRACDVGLVVFRVEQFGTRTLDLGNRCVWA